MRSWMQERDRLAAETGAFQPEQAAPAALFMSRLVQEDLSGRSVVFVSASRAVRD